MRILFFVYSHGPASGGHYHSLDQISAEVGSGNNVLIVTIGPSISPVLKENKFFFKHIYLNNRVKSLFKLNRDLKKIIKEFEPDILHCFDTESLNRLLVLPVTAAYPIVLNKCGGPSPFRKNYYHADGFVVFNKADYLWFKNNDNYKKELIFLIPNRVKKIKLLDEYERNEKKDIEKVTFIRVTRIGAYEKTLKDSIKMIEDIKDKYPVQLIIIGRIHDQLKYNSLKKEIEKKKLPVRFITDDRASKGSKFLYLADFVIGTGRSFMEALSLGIPTLTPAINSDWPVLVNEQNFENFFTTNFSERNIADEETLNNNKKSIIKLLENKNNYFIHQELSKNLFNKYLSSDKIYSKYNVVYQEVLKRRNKRLKLIIKNFPYLVKFYIIDPILKKEF